MSGSIRSGWRNRFSTAGCGAQVRHGAGCARSVEPNHPSTDPFRDRNLLIVRQTCCVGGVRMLRSSSPGRASGDNCLISGDIARCFPCRDASRTSPKSWRPLPPTSARTDAVAWGDAAAAARADPDCARTNRAKTDATADNGLTRSHWFPSCGADDNAEGLGGFFTRRCEALPAL